MKNQNRESCTSTKVGAENEVVSSVKNKEVLNCFTRELKPLDVKFLVSPDTSISLEECVSSVREMFEKINIYANKGFFSESGTY